MKLKDILREWDDNPYSAEDPIEVFLVHPETDQEVPVELIRHLHFDDTPTFDNQRGSWMLDDVIVAEPFEFMGRKYEAGTMFADELEQYLTQHDRDAMYDTSGAE